MPDPALHDRPHPLRSQPHRLSAHRRRPHRPVLLGLCPPPRRQVHPAHRGYRRRALDAGGGAGDSRRHALAGPGARRRPVLPDAAHGSLQGSDRSRCWPPARPITATRRRKNSSAARRAGGAQGKAALRRPLAARSRARRCRRRRPACRRWCASSNPDGRRRRLGRSGQGPHRDRQRRTRRLHHRPRRRHADLQLLRRASTTGTWASPTSSAATTT